MRQPIHTQNTPPIPHNQAIALEKLDDGRWHSLADYSKNTRVSLYKQGFVEDRGSHGIVTRADHRDPDPIRADDSVGSASLAYRITDAGRAMLRAKARAS